MTDLLSHISYLLYSNRYVSVEGLGSFMLSRRSANVSGNLLSAPEDLVSFSNQVIAGDRVLVNSIARRANITEEGAETLLTNEVEGLKHALQQGESISIPEVGTLSLEEDLTTIRFVADNRSSWLSPVNLEPIDVAPSVAHSSSLSSADYEVRRTTLTRSLRRTASSAAAIAVIALITFVISKLPHRHNNAQQVASMGIEQLTPSMGEKSLIITPGATEPALVLILNTPADGAAPAAKPSKNIEQADDDGRYCLVVASLASRAEADKFITAHSTSDLPLKLLQIDGRWRVYARSGATIAELSERGRELGIYERFPSAWICRR